MFNQDRSYLTMFELSVVYEDATNLYFLCFVYHDVKHA